MRLLGTLMIVVVALLHIGFAWLEMIAWTKPIGLSVFDMTAEEAAISAQLALNQGFYNLMLAVALLSCLFYSSRNTARVILMIIIAVGIFGGLTVSPKIYLLQALPALIAWILVRVHVARENKTSISFDQ